MALTPEILEEVADQTIEWDRRIEGFVRQVGRELSAEETAEAREAGVAAPERIRVATMFRIPFPDHELLRQANERLRLVRPDSIAYTVNHAILLREVCGPVERVLFHEFVHVSQFERMGLETFVRQYVHELAQSGYVRSGIEKEAAAVTAKRFGTARPQRAQ
jgi:hypothetical protein